MVFTAFALSSLAFGTLGSISVFLKPLSADLGWSRADTSFGYTVIALSAAVFGVLWGYIADRYGTKHFGLIGAVVMAGSLFLLSTQSGLFQFYLFYFLFGAFGVAVVTAPLTANVGFWFRKNPGLALGVTAAGGAIGQGIGPFFVARSIVANGWEQTYVIMALVVLCIALPIAFLVKESPHREQVRKTGIDTERDSPLSEVEVVVWLGIAIIFCCNCMAVPIVHLVPLLTDTGWSVETASGVLLILMLSGAVGRIMAGKLADIIGALPTYMIMSFGQAFFVLWFPWINSLFLLYICAILFGFTYSGVMVSIITCTRTMVGARLAARSMSLTSFFGWGGMGMGGFLGGFLFDYIGDYEWSFNFASAMGFVNLAILLLFYMRIRSKESNLVAEPAIS